MTTEQKFHAHLDACAQCREQPFNLCAVGQKLVREALAPPEPHR